MKLRGFLYKMTNSITRKVYIGQTRQSDVRKRIWQHFYEANTIYRQRNTYISRAIKKYGKENFTFEILFEVTSNTKENLCVLLDVLEKFYIKKFNSTCVDFGYNLTEGGQDICTIIKEHPKRLLIDRTKCVREKHPFTEERLKRMSEITTLYFKTHEHVSKGIPSTQEFSDKASEIELSEESKKHRQKQKEIGELPINIQKSKKLQQYIYYMLDLEGNVLKEFRSLHQAGRYINRDEKSIRKCLSGNRLTCAGYKWQRIKI